MIALEVMFKIYPEKRTEFLLAIDTMKKNWTSGRETIRYAAF